MRRPGRWRLSLRAKASGQARVYQAQTQVFHRHDRGGRATAVVKQIAPDQAAAPSVFIGRSTQVDQLLGLLDPAGSGPVATVVAGMGGVGKTTLARHVAQAAVGRGWFPGGAVWTDLYGYATDPADRVGLGQVVGPLLRALGVPTESIPVEMDEQVAVYHQILADEAKAGRPVLMAFDNTSSAEQVAGLLPAHGVHRVVVTSRHTLGDLDGARIVDLDVLDPAEAADLVEQALRERDPGDRRAVEGPDGAAALAEVCGRLPLALRIAAALLADNAATTVSGLADELANATTRLDGLAYEGRAVAAAFDLSWHHLTERDPAAARLFRLLPVNPGPDISTQAAATLTDLSTSQVRPLLRVLRRAHLLQLGSAPDRWAMHDLVSTYTTALPEDHPGERATATARLLGYYATTIHAANCHLRALPGQAMPDRFTDRQAALDWLGDERANLTAAVTLAAATGDHHTAVFLATALGKYLSWRRYLDDWVTTATTARNAVINLGNPGHEGAAWSNLGLALSQVRRLDEAITAHHTAIDIDRQTGDRHGESAAWNNLGLALTEVGKFDEAITALEHALEIYRQIGDRHGEGTAWGNLGNALREARRFDEAIIACQTARDIFRENGDRHGESAAWNNLGLALTEVGKFDEAITAHHTTIDIYQQTDNRHGESTAWNNLGVVLAKASKPDEAITAIELAGKVYRETRDRHREGSVWNNLGLVLAMVGKFDQAITALERAVDAFTESGAPEDADDAHRFIQKIKEESTGPSPDHGPRL